MIGWKLEVGGILIYSAWQGLKYSTLKTDQRISNPVKL